MTERVSATRLVDGLRLLLTCALAGVASFRCLSVQVSQRVFDVDPTLAMAPQAALGPGAGLWLDAMLLVASAVALLLERRAGRRVDWRIVVAALLPAAAILWHGGGSVPDVSRGATWLAAMVSAVALAHLARDAALRRLALGILLATVAPLAVRGAVQLLVEHPETVAHYQEMRDRFLLDRGWAPDSPAARTYERRLMQLEASGWFGLSNVYSSLLGATAVAFAMGLRRRDFTGPTSGIGLLVAMAGASAALLALVNGSKGAIGAMLIGAALAACALLPPHLRRVAEANAPRLTVAVVAAALLAIVGRGVLLPESFADERSLLFRWHYLANTAQMIPAKGLIGVGPDGFQDAYVAVRQPHHVEEVTSAHSVLLDWIAALGVLGWSWVFLALFALRRVGATVAPEFGLERTVEGTPGAMAGVPSGRLAAFVAMIVGGSAIIVEFAALDGSSFVMRLVGVGAWALLAAALAATHVGHLATMDAARRWALLGAVATLAAHAQLEMTMWLEGSVGWVACVVGAVATCRAGRPARIAAPLSTAATALSALVLGWAALVVTSGDRELEDAAEPLHRLGQARETLRRLPTNLDTPTAITVERRFLDAGLAETTVRAVLPRLSDPDPQQRGVGVRTAAEALRELEIDLRAATASTLDALPMHRGDARATSAASDQWLRRAMMLAPSARMSTLERAANSAEVATLLSPRLRHRRRLAEALEALAQTAPSHDAWVDAALAWREVVWRDPHGLDGLLRFADAAWLAGDAVEAERAWTHALEVDEALALDPLRQLVPARRAAVLARLATIHPPPSTAPRTEGEESMEELPPAPTPLPTAPVDQAADAADTAEAAEPVAE